MKPKAILIFGPAGSGKTSTAKRIGENKNWTHISEDEYWGEIKKGRPTGEYRTHEEQKIIWQRVLRDIKNEFSKNNNIALEFLVYEDPPKPLLFYKKELLKLGTEILIRILKPKPEVISGRRKERNLPHDRTYFDRKKTGAECKDHLQIEVLDSKHIKKEWIIEDSEFSLEDIYKNYFSEFVEK